MKIIFFLLSTIVLGQMHHGQCNPHAQPSPILSVADFNGDGRVSGQDISLMSRALRKREYLAFYDRDADGDFDHEDKKLAISEIGQLSTSFDQQLASLFHATEKYRNKDIAVADNYRPFTQSFIGHGSHYAKMAVKFLPGLSLDPTYDNPFDGDLVVADPEGLNYDSDGNLVAVFYYHGIDTSVIPQTSAEQQQVVLNAMNLSLTIPKPQLFKQAHQDYWHNHFGMCLTNLNYPAMHVNPNLTPVFRQHMLPQECSISGPNSRWIPAFNMVHVWLYKLNPCGVLAGMHPNVDPFGQSEESANQRTIHEWLNSLGLGGYMPYLSGH